jgi:FMN phosphatase YigB (HAD superfamily)
MPPARSTRILVLDFDGTVCIGDAPVLLYGRLLEERVRALPGHGSEHEEGGILPALEEYLAVEDRAALRRERSDDLDEAIDGYAAAQLLARRRGLGPEDMESAYQASRRALAVAGDIETSAPAGLAAFLEGLPRSVRRVLVTNAPADGIAAQLEHLGIAGGIDEIVPSARKPAGMAPILARLLAEQGLEDSPQSLLSVGDIWVNDLEPASALGARTALIDRHGSGTGTPDLRARTFPELYPAIGEWAREG